VAKTMSKYVCIFLSFGSVVWLAACDPAYFAFIRVLPHERESEPIGGQVKGEAGLAKQRVFDSVRRVAYKYDLSPAPCGGDSDFESCENFGKNAFGVTVYTRKGNNAVIVSFHGIGKSVNSERLIVEIEETLKDKFGESAVLQRVERGNGK